MREVSLSAEQKLRYASAALAYVALSIGLLSRNTEGLVLALGLSSLSLLLYLYQWSPSKRLLRTKLSMEDLFFACTSVILFSFVNVATKILLPIAMAISFTIALAVICVIAAGFFGSYALHLYVGRITHHRDFMGNLDNFSHDPKVRDRYERLGNSVIVASTFLALDAPDLMLVLAAVVSSSNLVLTAISRGLSRLKKALHLSRYGWDIARKLRRYLEMLDLEEALWTRVLYVTEYKRGLSYFFFALMSSLAAIFYSYSIDFLMPETGKLAVFILLALPGLVAVYALKLPRGMASTPKEAGRVRQLLIITSIAAPIGTIPAVYLNPRLLDYSDIADFSRLEFVGSFFGFVWLAIFPIVIALPAYSMIAAAEFEDYEGLVRRARLFAISPGIANSFMAVSAILVSNTPFPVSLVMFTQYFSLGFYFYPLVIFAAVGILRDVERRTGKSMSQWIDKVRGPRWSVELVALALGCLFFPLFIFVGTPYPWVISRQGLLFPHLMPCLFWTAGGVAVASLVFLVSQPKRSLDYVRIGLASSLGVMGQAILFVGLPYSVTIWAPWIVAIPIAYTIGSIVPMIVNRLLRKIRPSVIKGPMLKMTASMQSEQLQHIPIADK